MLNPTDSDNNYANTYYNTSKNACVNQSNKVVYPTPTTLYQHIDLIKLSTPITLEVEVVYALNPSRHHS